jgi:hypothetical protein
MQRGADIVPGARQHLAFEDLVTDLHHDLGGLPMCCCSGRVRLRRHSGIAPDRLAGRLALVVVEGAGRRGSPDLSGISHGARLSEGVRSG